jgi:hypothetical protein
MDKIGTDKIEGYDKLPVWQQKWFRIFGSAWPTTNKEMTGMSTFVGNLRKFVDGEDIYAAKRNQLKDGFEASVIATAPKSIGRDEAFAKLVFLDERDIEVYEMWNDGSIIPTKDFMDWIRPGLEKYAKEGPRKPKQAPTMEQLRKQVLAKKKIREKQKNDEQ